MTKIKVALRVRPLSTREVDEGYPVVVGVDENSAFITDIKVPERPSADSRQRFRRFDFDHAFWLTDEGDDGSSQEEIYDEMGPSLEESILEGYNACLLAYGQSGTGKTHTMLGTKEDPGLIPRLCQGLWKKFKSRCINGDKSFRMEVSFMEIYREKVRDLLTPPEKSLKLREHPQLGPHVQGLKRIEISEGLSILDLLWEGERRRATGATGSNRRSSRSHAIWTLYLTSTKRGRDGTDLITRNQVHLVDLAGSEKADLITTKHLLAEGKDINRSLVSLGNVISSLAEKASYIPYRDSTLTWLLKDSLGGNATTAIIITASPASWCHAQTLNSFRFAQRARLVENQPKINVTKSEDKPARRGSGIFSGMSPFDLKKDISRLASMIRSAQANGGILRSLAPANGWNRLISAIENWSHLEADSAENGRRENPVRKASSTETISAHTSVADGEVQVDMKPPVSSVPSSPSKVLTGTEVFIPLSKSFKCLTWRQEEVHQIPKTAEPEQDEDDVFVSPPTSPKTRQLKYVIPVHFPVTRNVDSGARMNESVNGNIDPLYDSKTKPTQICPIEIPGKDLDSPVICEKYPTLVNPQPITSPLKESVNEFLDENLNYVKSNVQCKGQDFCFHIPNVSDFSNQTTLPIPVFQSTDEDEQDTSHMQQSSRIFKLQKGSKNSDDTGFDQYEPCNRDSDISSSSYESLQVTKHVPRVKVVEKSHFNFAEIEDRCEKLMIPCTHTMASVLEMDDPPPRRVRSSPGTKGSKFRNFFLREIEGLEGIGKQIRNLKAKSERYNRIRPYLAQIDALIFDDHNRPDPKLDAEIEQCSGWSMEVEFKKVQNELNLINKILSRGTVPPPKTGSGSSISNPEFSSGSISMDSRQSGNHDSLFGQRSCKPVPILTSTPKKPPIHLAHTHSEFWSDFYKKNGPGGDHFSQLKSETAAKGSRMEQKWKPFLPKTHNYLCHQRSNCGNGCSAPISKPPQHNVRESYSNPQFLNQYLWQGEARVQIPKSHRRPHILRSLSSSDGSSSLHEGSQSDHYLPYGSEFCSCPDSLESNQTYWDTGFETEFPNHYHHHESYTNGFHEEIPTPQCNYPRNHLVMSKNGNRRGSNSYGKYKNEF